MKARIVTRILLLTAFVVILLWQFNSPKQGFHPALLTNSTVDGFLKGGPIPKIIHQTWKVQTLPRKWWHVYKNCRKVYPDYAYYFWTDEKAASFIEQEYPWFLDTYNSYKFPIQRVDALRYFLLFHYGGIYMDFDVGCDLHVRMDPLLNFEAVIPQTKPIGYSNDVMLTIPRHPFFSQLIHNLKESNREYFFPYLTVFLSTGPMFLSRQLEKYNGSVPLYALGVDLYSDGPNKMFKHYPGNTWHTWDAKVILFTWSHWPILTFVSIILIIYVFRKSKSRYSQVPSSPV